MKNNQVAQATCPRCNTIAPEVQFATNTGAFKCPICQWTGLAKLFAFVQPAETPKPKRGGARPGSGRPRQFAEAADYTAYLPKEMAASILEIGQGNFSAGVRELFRHYDETH